MAEADAAAMRVRAEAERERLLARAHGTEAVVQAENMRNADQIKMKVDLARIDALPDLVGRAGGADSSGGGGGAVNEVVDGVMSMALQLPAVKKLGEEVGLNIGGGIAGLSDSIESEADKLADPADSESDVNSDNHEGDNHG